MKTHRMYCFLAVTLLSGQAMAQTADGYGTVLRLPLVVNSATYSSAISVRNAGTATASVKMTYYGAPGTPFAGERPCTTLSVAPNAVVSGDLAAFCAVPVSATSNYGQIALVEQSAANVPIAAYSRIQSFAGRGFSVEAFKVGAFVSGANESVVTGLRRQAASPGYQSNCFVASINEPVQVTWQLRDTSGSQLGNAQVVNLSANETLRVLDVFTAVGAPAGDYSNVQATFRGTTPAANPAFAAYCTTQENVTYDGDFRIAKTADPQDDRSRKIGTSSSSALGTLLGLLSGQDRFGLYLQAPDYVSCRIDGTGAPQLEMRLEDPQGNVIAGGNNINAFQKVYLGERGTHNNGVNGLYVLKVESRNLLSLMINYGVTCETGNGANPPLFIGHAIAEEF